MKTILLIDSEARRRKLYARILTRRGYAVLHAASASSALDQSTRRPIDLCVVDTELEDMTGVAFLKSAANQLAETKVIFLSTFFRQDSKLYDTLMNELGVSLVLHRPIAPLEFGAVETRPQPALPGSSRSVVVNQSQWCWGSAAFQLP